jgi:hypothetical protein
MVLANEAMNDAVDANNPDRGTVFGRAFAVNPLSSIAQSWNTAINSVGGGSSCPFGGGYGGVLGCGMYVTLSADRTQNLVNIKQNLETWTQVTNDGWDATGNQYWAWSATCNYDCNTYYSPM